MDDELGIAWQRYLSAAERERRSGQTRGQTWYPHYSEDGTWQLRDAEDRSSWNGSRYEHGNWTAGFWHGVMWLRGIGADDREAARLAGQRLTTIVGRAHDSTTHDLGFLFYPSHVLAHQLGWPDAADQTASPADRVKPAHRAAAMLARRFNARGGYLQAFGAIGDHRSAGTSTIDTMLNLPLLWWAGAHGSDPGVWEIARWHARTSARLYFRPDGSTYHLLTFDPLSGALRERGTFQGASANSCWARGQAWAACGFAWAYAATGEMEFLDAADRAATYFFERLPDDGVPPWDFTDTTPSAPRDASAAAVTALGALILAEVHPDAEHRRRYAAQGRDTLVKVVAASVNTDADRDGILVDSCYSWPDGLGLSGATGWGDFFVGLALALATRTVELPVMLGLEPVSRG